VATPSKNFRSESVTAIVKELGRSNSVALRSNGCTILSFCLLFSRNEGREEKKKRKGMEGEEKKECRGRDYLLFDNEERAGGE